MDYESKMKETRQRYEELRRKREMRQTKGVSTSDSESIDNLVRRLLNEEGAAKGRDNIEANVELTRRELKYIGRADAEVGKEENTAPIDIIRTDKSVQTDTIRTPTPEPPVPTEETMTASKSSEDIQSRLAPVKGKSGLSHPMETKNSITAIKKRVSVLPNNQGLDQIISNLEAPTIVSSAGILERALRQVDDYDYMMEYAKIDKNAQSKKDFAQLTSSFITDTVVDCPVVSMFFPPSDKNTLFTVHSTPLDSKLATTNREGYCLRWNNHIPDHPERIFTCHESIQQIQVHPSNSAKIFGTTYSGRVVMWDVNAGTTCEMISNVSDRTHFLPIVAMNPISSVSPGFFTLGSDGLLLLWKFDHILEPTFSYSLRSLEYEGTTLSNIIPTTASQFFRDSSSILVGCQDGKMISVTIRESHISIEKLFSHQHHAAITRIASRNHLGIPHHSTSTPPTTTTPPVLSSSSSSSSSSSTATATVVMADTSTETSNPTGMMAVSSHAVHDSILSNLVLTASFDWTVALWLPSHTTHPLCVFSVGMTYVTDVAWNPVNPALFAVSLATGEIQFWNLLHDHNYPIHSIQTTTDAMAIPAAQPQIITRIAWNKDGNQLWVGMESGKVLLYEVKADLVEVKEEIISSLRCMIEQMLSEVKARGDERMEI